jgi:MoxR-like ATPase
VLDYALRISDATRSHPGLALGASPRASISLVRCAQAKALIDGREFVVPDDVKTLAVPALAHRVLPAAGMRLEPGRATEVVTDILSRTSVPTTSSTA